MKIYQALERDPRKIDLPNRGQARITGERSEEAEKELRQELETFVCDGEFGRAMQRVVDNYLRRLEAPRQDAAWVSGFFGSGKSHLLKMMGHLWADTVFPDGVTARSLVRDLPDDVRASLRELDTKASRAGVQTLAAAGTLPAGSGEIVRGTVLSIILRAANLPEQYPQAMFCFRLREEGHLDAVRKEVEAAGKIWMGELNNLYVSPVIARALMKRDPGFGKDERDVRAAIRAQFPPKSGDLTTKEFLEAARKALAPAGKLPLTILVLDEVQQYIGDSLDRAISISEVSEAVQTQLDSRVLLVGSGQAALASETRHLQRLVDRFRVTVQLSDADVEAVTRKVLLGKKASATKDLQACLENNAGEISKHLRGSKIAPRVEDRQTIEADYPLLPTRRRFWEECFRALDAAGTRSQLRSQLRILHDALSKIADREMGGVIPADALYDALAPDLINTSVLLNEISLRIQKLDDGSAKGKLQRRICAVVFLIGKLPPRDSAVDPGVRATPAMIADLLLDDIAADTGKFRTDVEKELEALAESGVLMGIGEEYRIQTTEGAEWDRALREKTSSVSEIDVASTRDNLFATAVQEIVSRVKLVHGDSRVRRPIKLHPRQNEPAGANEGVTVWLRDGWSIGQTEVVADARKRGQESPLIHVYLPKSSADDLRGRIVEVEACQKVIDLKGAPAAPEGREARESMESRRRTADAMRNAIVQEIVRSARVFQGGGGEVFGKDLEEKLATSSNASLARLYPRFPEADHGSWEVALKRTKDGSDEPFKIIDPTRPTLEHPVVKEVVAAIGNGASGTKIRNTLKAPPFGWSQDAIDAAIIVLHGSATVRATANGQTLVPGQLDQNKIPTAEFRPERVVLTLQQRIEIRRLFGMAEIPVKSGEEEAKAVAFLDRLSYFANAAGGEAPLPERPSTRDLIALRDLVGAEQLAGIHEKRTEIEKCIADWKKLADRAAKRIPQWKTVERLMRHAGDLAVESEIGGEINAITMDRTLLADADHVSPLIAKLSAALRAEVKRQQDAMAQAWDAAGKIAAGDKCWSTLKSDQQAELRQRHGLVPQPTRSIKTDVELLEALDDQTVSARADALAAVPERVKRALEDAAKLLKPKSQRVALRQATLETDIEVKSWVAEQEKLLLDAVKTGPVVVP